MGRGAIHSHASRTWRPVNDVPAAVATGTSIGSASVAWLAQANEWVSLIAGVVAIIAGIYAIAHYRKSMRKG